MSDSSVHGSESPSTTIFTEDEDNYHHLPFETIHCIFCGSECPAKFVVADGQLVKVKCEGEHLSFGDSAVDQQLKSVLIVRNILDVKEETCHELLSQFDGQFNPEFWVNLCEECDRVVDNYQRNLTEIAKLERTSKVIKLVLKRVIWESNHNGSDEDDFSGVWKAIREQALIGFDPSQVKKEIPDASVKTEQSDDDDLSFTISLILVFLLFLMNRGENDDENDDDELVEPPPPSNSLEVEVAAAGEAENATGINDENMDVDVENCGVEEVVEHNSESETLQQDQEQELTNHAHPLIESPVKLKRIPKNTMLRKIRKTKGIKILATWVKCSLCPARINKRQPSNEAEHRLLHEKGGPGVACNSCGTFVHKSRLDFHRRSAKCQKPRAKIERLSPKQPPPTEIDLTTEETNHPQSSSTENVGIETRQQLGVTLRPRPQRKGKLASLKKKKMKKPLKIVAEFIKCTKCPAKISKSLFAAHLSLHVKNGPGISCTNCGIYVHKSRYDFHQRSSKCVKPPEKIKNGSRKRNPSRLPARNIQVEDLLYDDESTEKEETEMEFQQIPEADADVSNPKINDIRQAVPSPANSDTTQSIPVGDELDSNDAETNGEVQMGLEVDNTETTQNCGLGSSSSPLALQPTKRQRQQQFLQQLVNSFVINSEEKTLKKRLTVRPSSPSSSFGVKVQKPTDNGVFLKFRISLKTVKKAGASGEKSTPSPTPSQLVDNQSPTSSKSPSKNRKTVLISPDSDSDSPNDPNIRKFWKVDGKRMYSCRRCPAVFPKHSKGRIERHQRLHQKGGNGWACPCCTIFIPESPQALEKHQRSGECLHPPPNDSVPQVLSSPNPRERTPSSEILEVKRTPKNLPKKQTKTGLPLKYPNRSGKRLHPHDSVPPEVPNSSKTRPQRERTPSPEILEVKRTPKNLPKKQTRTGIPMKYPKRSGERVHPHESVPSEVPSSSKTRPKPDRTPSPEILAVKRTPKNVPKKQTRTGIPMKYPKRSGECLHPPPNDSVPPEVPSCSKTGTRSERTLSPELLDVNPSPKNLPKKQPRTGLPMKYPNRIPEKSYTCSNCSLSISMKDMAYHEANECKLREHYKCKECSALIKPTLDQKELHKHLELHKKARKINCLVCGWLVDNIRDHNSQWHSKKHQESNQWALRHNYWVVEATNPYYILYKQEYVSKFSCRRCPAEFFKKEEMKKHAKLHNDNLGRGGTATCAKCSWLVSPEKLIEHMRRYHDIWTPSGAHPAWNCTKCGGRLLEEAKEEHQNLHKSGEGASCVVCGLLLKSNLLLVQHMAYFHPELGANTYL